MPNTPPNLIYLDYNATTPVLPEVVAAMQPYWYEIYGNPSSSHQQGQRARAAVEQARAQVADLVGVPADWVIFTGGATEANNLALLGTARTMPSARQHLIVSAIEHPAVMEPAKALQREGWQLSIAPVDNNGVLDLATFKNLLRDTTSLVSVMHANNETGVIQPIAEIAKLIQGTAVLHTDAAQSAGKIPVRMHELGAKMLVLAGHKFYAPKGVGALIRDPAMQIAKLDFGAGHEFGLRPGTENVPLLVGFGEAARLAKFDVDRRAAQMQQMRELLHAKLLARIPGLSLNGHREDRLPNTLNVSLPNCDAKQILAKLANQLAASAGSACHSDSEIVSGVLGAMNISAALAAGAIRFSVGIDTQETEITLAVELLHNAWRDLLPK